MEQLFLGLNQLNGEIPRELGNLTMLIALDLSNNRLSGEIPAELANLRHARVLYLSDNQLSEDVPHQLADVVLLTPIYTFGSLGGRPNRLRNLTSDFPAIPRRPSSPFEQDHLCMLIFGC